MIAARSGNLAIVTDLLQNGKQTKDHINVQEKVTNTLAKSFSTTAWSLIFISIIILYDSIPCV